MTFTCFLKSGLCVYRSILKPKLKPNVFVKWGIWTWEYEQQSKTNILFLESLSVRKDLSLNIFLIGISCKDCRLLSWIFIAKSQRKRTGPLRLKITALPQSPFIACKFRLVQSKDYSGISCFNIQCWFELVKLLLL